MTAVPDAVRDQVVSATLAELFAADPARAERYVVEAGDLRIDYSKHPVDDVLLGALVERVVEAQGLVLLPLGFGDPPAEQPEQRVVLMDKPGGRKNIVRTVEEFAVLAHAAQ